MLVPFAVTALLELVPTAQSSSHLPTLPFTLPGIHFLNLEELPETARLQLEPPLAVSFSESSFCHSSHPWSNVQYFGKTRKEGKINYILASGPFLPQIINFHVTLVSYSILTSLSYRMCYLSIYSWSCICSSCRFVFCSGEKNHSSHSQHVWRKYSWNLGTLNVFSLYIKIKC